MSIAKFSNFNVYYKKFHALNAQKMFYLKTKQQFFENVKFFVKQ